ncbi:uncharacterized protein LOC108868362 isoform X2 [Pyrus x bretschneideri]|uniref:uncharacterized protein LOC108868362 isoform X2 n=1 Tax=Pyrus x bretschneideri TaxID=225117 RepID=UPI00202E2E12|nr:uncharacterized protein LOC108868362 isoform X2 [Pyrus x bretschneideri]
MAESDHNHSSEMEARLDGKDHRWLRPEEICDVLRNPNGFTISKESATMPPSGSFFFFDKNVQRHFRKDGYEWKKTKDGKIVKEAHEKLKVEGVDAVHCYYAHREDDNDFQRRIYWLVDKNLSNMVLIHYRDIKVMPHTVSSNPSNFQHSQATYATNLNSTQTSEPENTVSASNHQASHGVLYVPGYEIASSISNSSNFQHSQATDAINFPDFQDNWFENLFIALPSIFLWSCSLFHLTFYNVQTLVMGESPRIHVLGYLLLFVELVNNKKLKNLFHICMKRKTLESGLRLWTMPAPTREPARVLRCSQVIHLLEKGNAVTPLATTEGVDEEEEGNDTNQSRKRLKVTCGQKSIATSAATNITAAPESSTPAMLQSRPTSDANQDFENQEQELEPTSIEPKNGKSKAVVQNDFGSGKSHEFSEVAVWDSYKSLLELLGRGFAPNTLASSSISTPATDSQAIETVRTFLQMDFATMAGSVKQTDMISHIKRLVVSSWFPSDSGKTSILQLLEQLEQPIRDYSEYDKGKKLNAQVEDMRKLLEIKVQFCDSKMRDYQRLENERKQIVAKQAVICAEVGGAVQETERNQAELNELLPQRDQFIQNEANLKTSLVIGDGYWTILKKVIFDNLAL